MNLAEYAGVALYSAALFLAAGTAQANCSVPAGYSETTPDDDFIDVGNGAVRHIPTGMIWKRCAEGQIWDGSTCTGAAAGYTWQQAFERAVAVNAGAVGTQSAGQTDWRLPSIKELRSIVEHGCINPSINATQFPNAPVAIFWSGSPIAGSDLVWGEVFGYGGDWWSNRNDARQVRLVRGGQYFYNFDAAVATPVIASGSPLGGTVGTPYNFTVTASGSPIYSATGLPPGLSIDPASGAISGTPTTAGSYPVTITVTNAGGSASQSYTVVVVAAVSAAPESIPTLSEWGALLLSALLGFVGWRAARRHSPFH